MSTLKSLILGISGSVLAVPIVWLIAKILVYIADEVLAPLIHKTPPQQTAIILLALLLLACFLITWVYLLRSKVKKLSDSSNGKPDTQQPIQIAPSLTIKNGVYYDQDGNAFCPTCKTLMTHQLPDYYDENYWWCNACKKYYVINPTDTDKELLMPFSARDYHDKDY